MIILVAIWFGLYLAKGITVPIQKLAEGTHEVAQGNLDYKIEAGGDDEIGVLMNSFNHMTGDLKQSKLELERRGRLSKPFWRISPQGSFRYPAGNITTWNKAAEQMLKVKADAAVGQSYRDIFRDEALPAFARSSTASKSTKASSARSRSRSRINCHGGCIAATLATKRTRSWALWFFLRTLPRSRKFKEWKLGARSPGVLRMRSRIR